MRRISLVIFVLLSSPAVAQDEVFRGMYTRDHEVHSFQPCLSDRQFWISGTQYVLGDLDEYMKATRARPYESVYLEFRGHTHVEAASGFAADYDGIIHVSEVQSWRRSEDGSCDDPGCHTLPSPVVGVERVIARSESEFEVYSIRGIGAVQLYRAPWSRLTLIFAHEEGQRFADLEGLSIVDVSSRKSLSVDALVRNGELLVVGTQLMIMPRDRPVNWRIDFVDYYR
jgi:hypothetical protein